ncbi:Caveolae-associated protein 4a [Ilyodon furcidens]|uniref:Muscle-restricted coiled-coil protein n=1 Tax=Ilyodon furcidens TaxID=33524 RepID=A0ABV0UH38_9TELE
MDQHKLRSAGIQEKLEIIGVEDEAGNPISALTILSLLERVAGIIDNVQSCQQRMEERQLELENNIKTVQGDVLKLAKDHSDTSGTVEKLLQKTRKVSANVKEVRIRVEKQNVRVKKVESTQDELLTRNKFRVVIYQRNLFWDHSILLRCQKRQAINCCPPESECETAARHVDRYTARGGCQSASPTAAGTLKDSERGD